MSSVRSNIKRMVKGGVNKEQTLKTKFTMNLSPNRIIINKKKTNNEIKVKKN